MTAKSPITEHLFVYGTLAPNRDNHYLMTPIARAIWQPATIRGQLREDGGWGSALGFPAVTLDDQGDSVHGFVLTSDDLGNHWQRLDDFEGESYQRATVTATLDSGEQVTAWVYAFVPSSTPAVIG